MARKTEPREMPPMTDAERRANWWHYHWHHVLIGIIALALLGGVVWEQTHKRKPDCSVALVTRFEPFAEELTDLQAALEAVCPDTNGDGIVYVAINSIQIDYHSTDLDDAAIQKMSSNVDKLNADFYTRQSGIFLLDDPESFQTNHEALAYPDGTVPEEGTLDWENMARPLSDCPALADVSFAGAQEELWLGRRVALTEADRTAFAGAAEFWACLFPEQAEH